MPLLGIMSLKIQKLTHKFEEKFSSEKLKDCIKKDGKVFLENTDIRLATIDKQCFSFCFIDGYDSCDEDVLCSNGRRI
jgi:hypothetical protein